jgi:hypothetical protein
MGLTTTNYYTFDAVSGATQDVSMHGQNYTTESEKSYSHIYCNTSSPPTTEYAIGSKVHGGDYYLYYKELTLAHDTTHYYRAYGHYNVSTSPSWGGIASFKTHAGTPTVGTPTLSGATSTTITVNANVTPYTVSSQVDAWVQYKKTVDSEWTTWGTVSLENATGTNSQAITETTVTSLTADTSYDFRIWLDRAETSNETTDYYSATAQEDTLPGEPTVTTDAATSITNDGATLNLTQDVNDGTTMTVYWKWGVQTPPTDNTTSTTVVTADGSTDLAVTEALASTKYYHQAYITFATPAGTPNSGDILDFTTLADPAAEAANQERVGDYSFNAKYGVAASVWICVPSIVSDDVFLTTASPFAAGDVKVSKDGGDFANITTLPSLVSAGKGLYLLSLSATEMEANHVFVRITDVAGGIFRDVNVRLWTRRQFSELDIDAATGTKANTTALKVSGYGSGHGLEAVAGGTGFDIDGYLGKHILSEGTMQSGAAAATTAVLAASENTDDNYYNGAIILWYEGTGAGQARVIIDHVNSTDTITLNDALTAALGADTKYIIFSGPDEWAIKNAAELSAIPNYASSFAEMLQYIWQRVFYKRTETATVHTMYKADAATALGTYGVDDDGATETKQMTEDA